MLKRSNRSKESGLSVRFSPHVEGIDKDLIAIKDDGKALSKANNASSVLPSLGRSVPISHCEIHEVPYNSNPDSRKVQPSSFEDLRTADLPTGGKGLHRRSKSTMTMLA